jgi:hypothetical protein
VFDTPYETRILKTGGLIVGHSSIEKSVFGTSAGSASNIEN